MRLLPKKQSEEELKKETDRKDEYRKLTKASEEMEKKKLAEIGTEIEKGIKSLNEFRGMEFAEREKIAQDHWALVSQQFKELKAIKKEVESLEARKAEALMPLTAKEKELDVKSLELEMREYEVSRAKRGIVSNKEFWKSIWDRDLVKREGEMDSRLEHYRNFVKYKEQRLKEEHDKLRKLFEELQNKSRKKYK